MNLTLTHNRQHLLYVFLSEVEAVERLETLVKGNTNQPGQAYWTTTLFPLEPEGAQIVKGYSFWGDMEASVGRYLGKFWIEEVLLEGSC